MNEPRNLEEWSRERRIDLARNARAHGVEITAAGFKLLSTIPTISPPQITDEREILSFHVRKNVSTFQLAP